ncbi:MAG TPA: hypothetical protein VGB92_08680 [Longimicrobium sp.]|jgi:hypothetical protein
MIAAFTDAGKLVVRYDAGDRKVWSVVRVPTPADDRRHLHRELNAAKPFGDARLKHTAAAGAITCGCRDARPAA